MKKLWRLWIKSFITYFSMAVIVIVLLIPIYRISYTRTREVLLGELDYSLTRNVNTLSRDLCSIQYYVNELIASEAMVHLSYLPDDRHYHLRLAIELRNELRQNYLGQALIASDFILNFKSGSYRIGRGGIIESSRYYGPLICYDEMDREEYERRLFSERAHAFPIQPVSTAYLSGPVRAYTRNFFGNAIFDPYCVVSAIITEQKLEEILLVDALREGGFLRISYSGGEPIYTYGSPLQPQKTNICIERTSDDGLLTLYAEIPESIFAGSMSAVKNTIFAYCLAAVVISAGSAAVYCRRINRPVRTYLRYIEESGLDIPDGFKTLEQFVDASLGGLTLRHDRLTAHIEELRRQCRETLLLSLSQGLTVDNDELGRFLGDERAFQGRYLLARLSFTSARQREITLGEIQAAFTEIAARLQESFPALYQWEAAGFLAAGIEKTEEEALEFIESVVGDASGAEAFSQVQMLVSGCHEGLGGLAAAFRELEDLRKNSRAFTETQPVLCYRWLSDLASGSGEGGFHPEQLHELLLGGSSEELQRFMEGALQQYASVALLRPHRAAAQYYRIIEVFESVLYRVGAHLELPEYDPREDFAAVSGRLTGLAHQLRGLAQAAESGKKGGEIIEYIDGNFLRPELSLSLLSDIFQLSETYISRLIKSSTGLSYSEYLELKRMTMAASLLKTTRKNINDIALATGYDNQSTFYKAFKRTYHVSPGSYRMIHRDQEK